MTKASEKAETVPVSPEVTRADLDHLERVIRDFASTKYVCPFNDKLVILMEHDEKVRTKLEEHDHDINGNAVPGMKNDVRTLMEERADRTRLNWLVVGAFIVQFMILYFK